MSSFAVVAGAPCIDRAYQSSDSFNHFEHINDFVFFFFFDGRTEAEANGLSLRVSSRYVVFFFFH